MPHGRLRYDIHAKLGVRRRASARVGSRDRIVDSVLIAGHAATADAGAARPGGLPVADAAGVVDKLGEDSDVRLAVGDRVIAYATRLGLHGGSYHGSDHKSPQHTGLRYLASITQESSRPRVSAGQKRYS
jgi:hypothetical protein